MIYPDKDTLKYVYNPGGLLASLTGKKKIYTYNYVKSITYDNLNRLLGVSDNGLVSKHLCIG